MMQENGSNSLMWLCSENPQLLAKDFANDLVDLHVGKRRTNGVSAITSLFIFNNADAAAFDSKAFRTLFSKEKEIVQADGSTLLI